MTMTMTEIFNEFYAHLDGILSKCGNNNDRIAELDKCFMKIAQHVFNGHFNVNGEYEIQPLDIEFYFHQEEGPVKESQMYHKGDLPYFPISTLCPNKSGVDVTFENEKQKIRASFLIRGYEYKYVGKEPISIEEKEYINTKKRNSLRLDTDGYIVEDFRPQYLWEDLFGNASIEKGLVIKWEENSDYYEFKIKASERLNVKAIDGENCRKWRFTNDSYLRRKFGVM